MRVTRPLTIYGLALLAGCAGVADRRAFQLTAEQVNGAWSLVEARAWRDAQEQGLNPFWGPQLTVHSGATCRWIEPGRRALCRYRVSRGLHRPGQERRWVDEEGELYLIDGRWDFGG